MLLRFSPDVASKRGLTGAEMSAVEAIHRAVEFNPHVPKVIRIYSCWTSLPFVFFQVFTRNEKLDITSRTYPQTRWFRSHRLRLLSSSSLASCGRRIEFITLHLGRNISNDSVSIRKRPSISSLSHGTNAPFTRHSISFFAFQCTEAADRELLPSAWHFSQSTD